MSFLRTNNALSGRKHLVTCVKYNFYTGSSAQFRKDNNNFTLKHYNKDTIHFMVSHIGVIIAFLAR